MNENKLPRVDLREGAFRKYEPFIAKASKQRTIFTPSTMTTPMKPQSFIARFRDAVRGYKLFKYHSIHLSDSSCLDFTYEEYSNGSVAVIPKRGVFDSVPTFSTRENFLELARNLSKTNGETMKATYLIVPKREDREWIITIQKQPGINFIVEFDDDRATLF